MRFTFFGLTLSSAWGNGHATPYRALLKALWRRGHQITFFEKDVEYYALRRDFASCEYCDLEFYSTWTEVRSNAISAAAESDVAIVASYCPEGARITDEILALPAPIKVFYDLDTPVTLRHLESGDLDYLRGDQIREFDLVLSFTGGKALDTLRRKWQATQVQPLYGCVDPDSYLRTAGSADYNCDLSYMGTYAASRQEKLDTLFLEPARQLRKKSFVLSGALYPWQWTWPENVRRFDHIAPGNHPVFFSSSRCTLNLTRHEMADNGYCPSGRFFEASACGTPILTDSWAGLEQFFTTGEELLVVENADDVISAMRRAESDLSAMAARARQRTLDEHTGDRRATQLLHYLGELPKPASAEASVLEAAS